MSKQLDDKAAEALRQLGHTEDEIAELAQKNKALPDEENIVEKQEETTGAKDAPAEQRKTFWAELGEKLGITKAAPVASEPEEAERDKEVTDPATPAEPAEKAGGDEPSVDVKAVFSAMAETVAKSIGEMVKAELDERDKRIAALQQQVDGLNADIEEKVEQRLRDVPPVVKVAASQVAATAVPDAPMKGLTFGNQPQGMQDYNKSLLGDIGRLVEQAVAQQFKV